MPSSGAQQTVYRPSNKFLQRIDRLKRSSPDFPLQLAILFGESAPSFTSELQPKDVEWLIEYLDNVLSALDPVNRVYRECLDQLGRACSYGAKLPQSQMLSVSSLVPIPNPTPIGPYEACYQGLLNSSKVCVKKLKPSLARHRHDWKSCFQAIVKWNYLTHSNIVPFLGIINEPIQFVSALAPGKSVTAYITGSPDTADPLSLSIGIASGIQYLHSRGVAHGDLGGPNIIIDHSGHPRIANFGLRTAFLTNVFDEVRTCRRWASPQVLRGDKLEYWVSPDIFSFAMVVVEAFAGQIPFSLETDDVAQSAIVEGKRPARPTHPDFTDQLWALVERCWNEKEFMRPGIFAVVRTLHDCRSTSMRIDRRIMRLLRSPKTRTTSDTGCAPCQDLNHVPPHQDPNHESSCEDLNDVPLQPETRSSSTSPHSKASTRKRWIRRLPTIIKQRLIAPFRRRIEPAILDELHKDAANTPPTTLQEPPTNSPSAAPQEDPTSIPSTSTRGDTASVPSVSA